MGNGKRINWDYWTTKDPTPKPKFNPKKIKEQ